ncbi:MAG: DUF3822 family protein [Chitinophagales bacterium]
MINQQYHIEHPLFANSTYKDYNLSLFLGKTQIAFAATHRILDRIELFKAFQLEETDNFFAYKLQLKDLLEQESILKATFAKATVAVDLDNHTLVPYSFYEKTKSALYYHINFQLEDSNHLSFFVDDIASIEAKNIYTIDKGLMEWVTNCFENTQNCVVKHMQSYLLDEFLNRARTESDTIYYQINKGRISITGVGNKQVFFQNYFETNNEQDALYYVLNMLQELNLEQEDFKHICIGSISETDQLYQALIAQLPTLVCVQRPMGKLYANDLQAIPAQYFYHLFCIN